MTSINIAQLILFEAEYDTHALPPPYSYYYKLSCKVREKVLAVDFILTYTGRDELEEEEIYEEGFTLADNYSYTGELPSVWIEEIKNKLNKSSWPKHSPKEDQPLILTLQDSQGSHFKGIPANADAWEYFLQEMIQAIYESGKKEMPLVIKYMEITAGHEEIAITLQPIFSTRTLEINYSSQTQEKSLKEIPWQELKKILKAVYIPDYDPAKAESKAPGKTGKYIDVGEGIWYKFGKGATDPGKENNSLERLEQLLKGLL